MILVTGGFGSIGAHTALALADLGEQVVVSRHRKADPSSFLEEPDGPSNESRPRSERDRSWSPRSTRISRREAAVIEDRLQGRSRAGRATGTLSA